MYRSQAEEGNDTSEDLVHVALPGEQRSQLTSVFSQDDICTTGALDEVATAILPGSSLANTSVAFLKFTKYNVAASGSVENYTKWPLIMEVCEIKRGYMNVPMRNVMPGEKEGFASHKFGHLDATGTWVRITFRVDHERFIHLMYSIPYNQHFHSNRLAVAVCPTSSSLDLDAYKMYYGQYHMMDRKEYKGTIQSTKIRNMGLCVIGQMGTSHMPDINIQIYPDSFNDLNKRVREVYYKIEFTEDAYQRFIDVQFPRKQ